MRRLPRFPSPRPTPPPPTRQLPPRRPSRKIHPIQRRKRILAFHLPPRISLRQFLREPMSLREFLAIVKQQFITWFKIAQREEFNPVFAVDEHDFRFAVQAVALVVCVVDEAGVVAEAGGVDDPFVVEVEEEGEQFAVVDYAPALGFIAGYYLWVC